MKAQLFKTKSEAKAWKQSEEDYGLTCVIEDYNGKYLVECRKQQKEISSLEYSKMPKEEQSVHLANGDGGYTRVFEKDYDSTTTSKQQKEKSWFNIDDVINILKPKKGDGEDLFHLEPKSGFLYRVTEVDEDDNPLGYEFAGKLINDVEPKKQQKDTSYWTRRAALAIEDINRNMTPEAMVKHISESCKRMDEMENEIFDDTHTNK